MFLIVFRINKSLKKKHFKLLKYNILNADDGFGLVRSRDRHVLVNLMERKLENTVKWLKKSGMKVNEAKTDLCLFHSRDQGKA